MMIERLGSSDAYVREIYDADIALYGFPVFSPGNLVYVDPASVGIGDPSDIRRLSQRLGMGGYYTILETTSVIESGKFETFLKTKFHSSGDICGTGEGAVTQISDTNTGKEKCVPVPKKAGTAPTTDEQKAFENASGSILHGGGGPG